MGAALPGVSSVLPPDADCNRQPGEKSLDKFTESNPVDVDVKSVCISGSPRKARVDYHFREAVAITTRATKRAAASASSCRDTGSAGARTAAVWDESDVAVYNAAVFLSIPTMCTLWLGNVAA